MLRMIAFLCLIWTGGFLQAAFIKAFPVIRCGKQLRCTARIKISLPQSGHAARRCRLSCYIPVRQRRCQGITVNRVYLFVKSNLFHFSYIRFCAVIQRRYKRLQADQPVLRPRIIQFLRLLMLFT